MSEKWIPWKSYLISSWEVKTDQASFDALGFSVFPEYLSSFSKPLGSFSSTISHSPQAL
jgi:hypothetical protein